ncbi:hypothetical protein WJX82_006297 [Trebouxia sp. C0006]
MANLTGKLPVSLGSCLQRSCVHRCVSAHPHTLRQPARTPHRGVHTVVAAADKECISTDKAPGAVGPYSQAVKTGNMLFLSGQIGLIPGTKDFAGGDDVEAQTQQVMQNMGATLTAGGSSFDKVIKTTVLLADMEDFQKVNAVYGKFFPENPPARACFAVKTLPLNARVEIEAVAVV